jgi:hypothetical protein
MRGMRAEWFRNVPASAGGLSPRRSLPSVQTAANELPPDFSGADLARHNAPEARAHMHESNCITHTEQDGQPMTQDTEAPTYMTIPEDATGIWNVKTRDSMHVFDLDKGTVERIPGPYAHTNINDRPRPVRSVDTLVVGEPGRWTMFTDGWSDTVDYFWHVSSVIHSIEPVPASTQATATAEVTGGMSAAPEVEAQDRTPA